MTGPSRPFARRAIARLIALALTIPATLGAQGTGARGIPTWREAVARYNAPGTTRVNGPYALGASERIGGTVAVLTGPVRIAGTVAGDVVAVNADVRLEPSAVIEGDVLVLGGTLDRAPEARIEGEVRLQAEVLRYHLDAGVLIAEETALGEWIPGDARDRATVGSSTELFHVSAATYNRVEGLPVLIGPKLRRRTRWGGIDVSALGLVRTAGPVAWDRGTLGHEAAAQVRIGEAKAIAVGARAFDRIDAIEAWQISDTESGLATWIAHRDQRDYYGRHGGEVTIGGRVGGYGSFDLFAGRERWRSVAVRDPVTLSRARETWRPNPIVDEGVVDLRGVRLRIDTREKLRSPLTGGWFVQADLERGRGTLMRAMDPRIASLQSFAPILPMDVAYTRGFLDARRRTRVSPGTELSLRLVAAGSLGGNRLPLQRRVSIGGPGSVEGYDFRRAPNDAVDVFTCGGIGIWPGDATQCDRILLAQAELRQPVGFDWRIGGDDWSIGMDERPSWVLFADAGRGWMTPGTGDPALEASGIPPLGSFRTSLGVGLDFGGLGLYLAKAVSTGREPMNLLLRVGRRF